MAGYGSCFNQGSISRTFNAYSALLYHFRKITGKIFLIRQKQDVYQVLTNKGTLELVLQRGLKEKHMQYKDKIMELFTNMKDRIKVEDLTVY